MKRLSALLLCAGTIVLAGCATNTSQAPNAITFPRTEQQKMQAAHHWEVLAEHQANRILDVLKDKSKPIFVKDLEVGASLFAQAYHAMLQSHLTEKDGVVVTKPVFGGVTVSYMTQILHHKDRAYKAPPQGTYTALGAGAVIVGATIHNAHPSALAAVPIILAADALSGGYAAMDPTEVIITTQVHEGNLVLFSGTDIFYFNSGDAGHYLDKLAMRKGQVFQVVDQ